MLFRQLFDPESSTYTYLLADEQTREAVLIDPVRDQVERDTKLLSELGLRLLFTLETHVHADHVTASGTLRSRLGSQSVLGRKSGTGCADRLVAEGETVKFGNHRLQIIETPGHTGGCVSYYDAEGGRVFTGDALLIRGCGRTDFQGGDPAQLYASVTTKLFKLPDGVAVYPGHDYRGHTASSIGEEKTHNPRLGDKTEAQFVTLMNELKLKDPKKIAEAVPANLACGVTEVPMAADAPPRELAWAPITRDRDGVPEVTAEWLGGHTSEVRVIDVREPSEYSGELGHIEGSELAPLSQLGALSASWDREGPLVVVCRSGRRSAAAALDLERAGFRRVASLREGMTGWRGLGLKASFTAAPTPAR